MKARFAAAVTVLLVVTAPGVPFTEPITGAVPGPYIDAQRAEVSLAGAQPLQRPGGDSTIAGRVLTESGEAVEGAQVLAFLFTGQPQSTARYATTTGSDGSYVLEGLPAGQFRVTAEKAGYSNLLVQPGRIEGGTMVELAVSSAAVGIDLVLRRTGSLDGRVTRPDGTPVQNARVVAEVRLGNDRMVGTGRGVVTDSLGRYRLEGVPPGTYVITASYSALHETNGGSVLHEYQDWARTFHGSTSDVERAIPIVIEGGDHLPNIDITLQPAPRYRVSGVIVTASGSVPGDIRVEYASAGGTSGVLTKVPEDGRFTIGGVAGAVTVFALGTADGRAQVGVLELNVSSSMDDVRLTLAPPARVRGRVRFDGPAPSAETSLHVHLAPEWSRTHTSDSTHHSAAVGEGGRFSVENVIGERRVTLVGLMPQWGIREVRRGSRVLDDHRIALSPGELVDDLEIVIARKPNH